MERKNLYILLGIALAVMVAIMAVGYFMGKTSAQHLDWMTDGAGASRTENSSQVHQGNTIPTTPGKPPIERARAVQDLAKQRNSMIDETMDR